MKRYLVIQSTVANILYSHYYSGSRVKRMMYSFLDRSCLQVY